ncbi:MAG: helix-turn-helix transcriptional regulator [Ruminococcaceae bacterium]|nr:helix-turn-helix transcriptional regulator [Oscillospiraceae bacterium]
MDTIKIGAFLRELRKENGISQEQLAEKFNVSSRSVSRWENGNTMPDISIMIELADYYDIDIRDLLRGERKSEKMEEDLKETLVMVADYTEAEKAKILHKVYVCGTGMMITSVLTMILYFIMSSWNTGMVLTPLLIILAGGIFAINTIAASLQLKGRMSKERNKKLIRITVIIWVTVVIVILFFMTFILPKILWDLYGANAVEVTRSSIISMIV